MITTLADAQSAAITVLKNQGIELLPEEIDALNDSLSFTFQEKLREQLTEQQLESLEIDTENPETLDIEKLEPQLFHLIPNYATLLEEVATEIIASRLLSEYED